MKYLLSILLLVLFYSFSVAQTETDTLTTSVTDVIEFNDGPYIFIQDKKLIEKTIVDGQLLEKELAKDSYPLKFKAQPAIYNNVEKVAAFSDIHGQYDLAIEILTNNRIIDDNLNWNFGRGHFVIVGDIFDRGDQIMEMLWFIYKLEEQAEAAGGKVHYLLGNHEYMVLQGDERYINKKYHKTTDLLQTSYQDLFGPDTVLGRWLRSKATVLKINNDVFVHGGISKDFLAMPFKIEKTNKNMRKGIDIVRDTVQPPSSYQSYFGNNGPIWYRGYFYDKLPDTEIVEILDLINSDHVIVGHCSNEEVVQLYDKKIFGVDSSIKNGDYGEILIIENNIYSRHTKDGEKMDFN